MSCFDLYAALHVLSHVIRQALTAMMFSSDLRPLLLYMLDQYNVMILCNAYWAKV